MCRSAVALCKYDWHHVESKCVQSVSVKRISNCTWVNVLGSIALVWWRVFVLSGGVHTVDFQQLESTSGVLRKYLNALQDVVLNLGRSKRECLLLIFYSDFYWTGVSQFSISDVFFVLWISSDVSVLCLYRSPLDDVYFFIRNGRGQRKSVCPVEAEERSYKPGWKRDVGFSLNLLHWAPSSCNAIKEEKELLLIVLKLCCFWNKYRDSKKNLHNNHKTLLQVFYKCCSRKRWDQFLFSHINKNENNQMSKNVGKYETVKYKTARINLQKS